MRQRENRHGGRRRRAGTLPGAPASALLLFVVMIVVLAAGAGAAPPSPGTARVWTEVSVTTDDGWTYRGVDLSWLPDGSALLMVRDDGAERVLAPEAVRAVRDAGGRDLGDEIAAGRPAAGTPPATEPSPHPEIGRAAAPVEESPRRLSSPLFDFAGDFGLGYGLPAGDWYFNLDAAWNAQLGMRFGLERHTYLRALFRHQGLGTREYEYLAPGEIYNADFSSNEYLLMIGRHGDPLHGTQSWSVGYFEAGLGVQSFRASSYGDSYTESKLALALQFGLWFEIGDRTLIDLSTSFVHKPGWTDEYEAGGSLISAHVALMFTN